MAPVIVAGSADEEVSNRMRILLVSHEFPPKSTAGTATYTARLALALCRRGHDARIFTSDRDARIPHMELVLRKWEGLVVHELVNNRFYDRFDETWDWRPAESAFARVLAEFQPDVVHVMHLMFLSVGCVDQARKRRIPVFFTLHDYWLQCPRWVRQAADGSLCPSIDFEKCGQCLSTFWYSNGGHLSHMAKIYARLRSATGLNLWPIVGRSLESHSRRSSRAGTRGAVLANPREMAAAVARRDWVVRQRLFSSVERFFAPSRFLLERFLEWGLPAERIEHLTYGIDLEPFRGFRRTPSDDLRVAFLGSLVPHKGAHVLLDAWGRLPPPLRDHARLTLYGPKELAPDYVAALERTAASLAAALPGGLAPEDVARTFREIDILVVPSTWYENSPLVIHEALATCTPLLVANIGGMAELVRDGRQGWHFRAGDPEDLARALRRVLADPTVLEGLDFTDSPVKGIETHAEELAHRYGSVVQRPAPSTSAMRPPRAQVRRGTTPPTPG